MSYRVEVSTYRWPKYSQEGPTCLSVEAATELLQDVLTQPEPDLRGVRIRDLGRNPAKQDQIIVSVEYPRGR
jgi:hypothetical protein